MRWSLFFLLLTGCPTGSAGNTVLYALDAPPVGLTDPALCAPDIGLELDLGFADTIGFSIDSSGSQAWLSTCELGASGQVTACGLMVPETELLLDGDTVTGSGTGRVDFTDSDCSGADVTIEHRFVLDGDLLTGTSDARWQLDPTAGCEALESTVIAQSGRGITGCLVNYRFTAVRHAECDNSLDRCRY